MMLDLSLLKKEDIRYLEKTMFDENEQLKILNYEFYSKIESNHLKLIAHKYGIYSFPTVELCAWLKHRFDLTKAIEIGSGNGAMANYLNIPATDAKISELPEIKEYYKLMKQPIVKYGNNVLKYDAISAIRKFKPETVIAQWITHKYDPKRPFNEGNVYGVDEQWVINNVKNYVFIGNEYTHKHKFILEESHQRIKKDWLVSRSLYPHLNLIYLWSNHNA